MGIVFDQVVGEVVAQRKDSKETSTGETPSKELQPREPDLATVLRRQKQREMRLKAD